MSRYTLLINHGVALGMIAVGIIVLLTETIGWLVFTAWMILTVVIYVCGWVYYLMVVRDRIPWDIDLDL
jgi:predicted membrane channel-forming protein YqfA (hemolysin III family)